MRVTTGLARGRTLVAPQGMDTRPSSDMTKQAVFNIIQNYVEGCTFLDLFAGSGQMGIEALSRGAKHTVFVDAASKAVEAVRANLKHCKLSDQAKIAQMDAASFLRARPPGSTSSSSTRRTSRRLSTQCCRWLSDRWLRRESSCVKPSATSSCPSRQATMRLPRPIFTAKQRLQPIAAKRVRRKNKDGTTGKDCGGARQL